MDVGGSFLELACVRIALIPTGSTIPDERFEELTSYITSFREVPVSALPRRNPIPRASGSATFSTMPPGLRETLTDPKRSLPRSRSTTRDIGRSSLSARNLLARRPSSHGAALTSSKTAETLRSSKSSQLSLMSAKQLPTNTSQTTPDTSPSKSMDSALKSSPRLVRLRANLSAIRRTRSAAPACHRNITELDLASPDVGSTFRLRYDVVHRDHAGDLIMKPFSEWDAFHSSKMWGVIGIVDCTQPGICDNEEERKNAIKDAYSDFQSVLSNFKDAVVKRLFIFTTEEAAMNASTEIQDDLPIWITRSNPIEFSTGYVPDRHNYDDTRREVRAQFIHFAGLVLNAIDKNCAKLKEVPGTELFVSPIDGKHSIDRQSQLTRRRAGRLDKLLGDCLLLMGSPEEALLRYNSAIERAKANSDRLWIAGAMEGWAAAHTLTYISSGGNVKDITLSDRLIEHYAEIFKLYQKKRVAEPEATAAMRLAEFLGTWGNRRKESLDAAEHAASVGEALKPTKRAALWEALARYSDRMGYRRKAALYLYRLGQLNASQSIWSSAVALMTACENQLSIGDQKPWNTLNRDILLMAANHAQNSGDSTEAARLYSEALVIQPSQAKTKQTTDAEVLKLLRKSQVPAFLPAATRVVKLVQINPLKIPGLSVRNKDPIANIRKSTSSRAGPFIYNPFEAKKRAKAASTIRQPVRWVCGEPAQISVGLINCTETELMVEVVAVLVFDDLNENDLLEEPDIVKDSPISENHVAADEQLASIRHRNYVRQVLESSTKLAKTITETINLDHGDGRSEHKKHITIVPRRTGSFRVGGLLIRLFGGALVVLRLTKEQIESLPVIKIISALPRISLSAQCCEGEMLDTISNRTPMTIFDGERRSFRVVAENTGTSDISQIQAKISSSRPNIVEVTAPEFANKNILSGLEKQGGKASLKVQILGTFTRGQQNDAYIDHHRPLATVNVSFDYEGTKSPGTIRESTIQLRVSSQAAIQIGKAIIFEHYSATSRSRPDEQSRMYCIAVDITNDVSVPAQVSLSQAPDQLTEQERSIDEHSSNEDFGGSKCLVEAGASARVVGILHGETLEALRALMNPKTITDGDHLSTNRTALYVSWSLPALGRHGKMDLSVKELWKATLQGGCTPARSPIQQLSSSYATGEAFPIELQISIDGREEAKTTLDKLQEREERNHNVVELGRFWTATIEIWNSSGAPLPQAAELDIELFQRDGQGLPHRLHNAVIVGAVQNVAVGSLKQKSFKHRVLVRMSSSGTFHLQACLYNGSSKVQGNITSQKDGEKSVAKLSASNITNSGNKQAQTSKLRHSLDQLTNGPNGERYNDKVNEESKYPTTPPVRVRAAFSRWGQSSGPTAASQYVITPLTIDSFPGATPLKEHSITYACSVRTFTARSAQQSL